MGYLDIRYRAALNSVVIITTSASEEQVAAFEERAAIAEYDGELSRAEAESLARAEIRAARADEGAGREA